MKSFLMFRDRDFNLNSTLPDNHMDLIHDLGLDILFSAMSKGDELINDVVKHAILIKVENASEIQFRQEILKDCLKNAEIIRRIYQIALSARERKRNRWLGIFSHYPSSVLSSSVKIMLVFFDLLKELRSISDAYSKDFSSSGFKSFFNMIKNELDDDYLHKIDYHLRELQFPTGMLASMRIGRGNECSDYSLRLPKRNNKGWLSGIFKKFPLKLNEHSFIIPARDDAGHRALSEILNRNLNDVAIVMAQSVKHIENFFLNLQLELSFYLGCLNLYETLKELDCPVVFPCVESDNAREHNFKDLLDICLVLTMKQKIVGNDLQASNKDMVIITGANQGGKSTFLRSVGVSQLMMEAGMFVPAEYYSASLTSGVFTHYKREEDTTMRSGKLDEELERMSGIVDLLSPNSLVLLNESFSSTNEHEGSEIAFEITRALMEQEVKIFFVTHMYGFSHYCFQQNKGNILFLRAERQLDRTRPYKLVEGEPLLTSFGLDIYRQVFEND